MECSINDVSARPKPSSKAVWGWARGRIVAQVNKLAEKEEPYEYEKDRNDSGS